MPSRTPRLSANRHGSVRLIEGTSVPAPQTANTDGSVGSGLKPKTGSTSAFAAGFSIVKRCLEAGQQGRKENQIILSRGERQFQSGQGGFWRRAGYSVSRIFVTRTDSGGHQFNYSEIVGSAISSGISTYSYHPKGDRTVANTASVWGTQLGYDTITIVVKEFWPDIRRKLSKKK